MEVLLSSLSALTSTVKHLAWSESFVADAGSDSNVPEGEMAVTRSPATKPQVEFGRS